ncbi:uncharacterized protein [Chiloscyllium punctatum]|uniref:uncharacterized protein isoform X2 n=1 Tax=Chiloscyllium punctatum TaxID=137246 RepID=UPI003B63E356
MNVTVQTELYRTGDDLDTVTLPEDHRLPPIQRSANESSPARQSGVAPGFAAAAIFIGFLLVLYAVLWKCMSSKVRRDKDNGRSRQKGHHSEVDSC